jgi:CheY-like chemotaxis protein
MQRNTREVNTDPGSSFYLYRHLEKIHADFQHIIQKNRNSQVILIMNTPGSLEHFMIHSDPGLLHTIFIDLLTHLLMYTERGCIEFGYILQGKDQFHFFVRECTQTNGDPNIKAEKFYDGPMMEGLAGTIEMVQTLGGHIWGEYQNGRNVSWWFTFDVQPKHSRNFPFRELSDSRTHPDWSGRTILVVEDVYNNYLLMETLLAPTGIRLINVENGMKAVNYIKKNQDVDLVLMDLRLPVLDGYEASRRIKAHCPWLPIVAVSAYAVGEEIDRCLKAGCDSFLGKPVNTSELIRTITALFQKMPANG